MAEGENSVRVLVIDDSFDIRDFVAEYVLLPNGYEPILARDGAEGVRKVLAEAPDLILLDYELPKMNGLEVLTALRQREVQTPVILMTSHGSEQIAVQVFRMGVRDYIIKPFTVDQMLRSLHQVMLEVQLRREKAALTKQVMHVNRQLRQRLTELNALYQIGKSVTALMPLDVLLGRIADAALYITAAEECTLMLDDPETGRPIERARKRRGSSRTKLPGGYPSQVPPATTTAMLHVPLQVGTQTIGILGVGNKQTPRAFNDHDKQMLQTLADYAAIAIQNVQLLDQVERAKEREKQEVQNLFERYVAPSVVKELLRQADTVALGGRRQVLSVLFADIRGFTPFSAKTTPEVLVEVLNQHLAVAAEAILAQEGTLDKFMGDAVVAFFNAPLPQSDHALRAVRAALAIHRAVAELHRTLPRAFRLRFGVGVSVGEAVVGNIGTPRLMNYTIVGEAVNTSERLQGVAKGGQTLVCQHTVDLLRDHVRVRPLGTVDLRGLPARRAFELVGLQT